MQTRVEAVLWSAPGRAEQRQWACVVDNTPPPGTLQLSWRGTLDLAVYGEPWDVDGNVVVPKENNPLYALSLVAGAIFWKDHDGWPVTGVVPCLVILPLGITGTRLTSL